MTNEWNFEEEISALEALLDEMDEEPKQPIEPVAKPPVEPAGLVSDLLKRAKEKIAVKYTSVPEAQEALNAVMGQVSRINDALMEMAKCSREYANGEIDDQLRCERIKNIMDDIRVPVKELQLQMGRKCDSAGAVTEGELRDFRDYLEGFVIALREHIQNLGGNPVVSAPASESKTEKENSDEKEFDDDDEDEDEDDDKEEKDDDDDKEDKDDDDDEDEEEDEEDDDDVKEKKKEAKKFTKVCESLMVRTSYDSAEDDLSSALESLLNDITEL